MNMSDLRDKPGAIRPGEELDLGKLEPFLRSHFPGEAGHFSVTQFPSDGFAPASLRKQGQIGA